MYKQITAIQICSLNANSDIHSQCFLLYLSSNFASININHLSVTDFRPYLHFAFYHNMHCGF